MSFKITKLIFFPMIINYFHSCFRSTVFSIVMFKIWRALIGKMNKPFVGYWSVTWTLSPEYEKKQYTTWKKNKLSYSTCLPPPSHRSVVTKSKKEHLIFLLCNVIVGFLLSCLTMKGLVPKYRRKMNKCCARRSFPLLTPENI